ncbi:hypothetical protein L0244_38760 [bacterium]|nr:hypothetical protein [bacterium]
MKVKCLICGRKMLDTFQTKWRHILKIHPDEAMSRLIPMLADPSIVRERGNHIAQALLEEIKHGWCRGIQ